jgi:alpha-1,4-galacturonosyltransferase
VVTDSLNLPAISMWFLLNPPGKATIQIQGIDNFERLSTKYHTTLKKQSSSDPRYTSELNHLRFYLPDIFPALDKIVLFDHDVVVQRDLTELWSINMKGKVNGAVETCHESEALSRRMDLLINFSDPLVAKRFDVNACTWAFGMNLFDLREWRRQNLTAVYHKYLQLVNLLCLSSHLCVCLYVCGFKFSLLSIRNTSTNAVLLKDVYFCCLRIYLWKFLLRFFLWPVRLNS